MQENNENKANMQLSNIYVVLLVFILGLVSLGIFFVNNSEKDKTITVSGKSSSMQKNEIASFSVTAEANNADKQVAVKEVTDKSQEIVAAIKQFGIEDKDIQTTNLNVYQTQDPILEKGVTVYRPGNWYATYMVNITLRDLTKSTELTDLLAGFDKTSIYGPNLRIDDKNINEEALLQAAIANAKSKATAMAAKAGKRIGGVVSIIETTPNANPILYAKGAESMTGLGGGEGLPIEAGTT